MKNYRKMGTKSFSIKTFNAFNKPVIEFEKRVYDQNGKALEIAPGKEDPAIRGANAFTIDIHKVGNGEDERKYLRETGESITIELIPDWENKSFFYDSISKYLNFEEKADDVLILNARLICPQVNYVIESQSINLNAIDERKPIIYKDINLNDVIGKIEFQSELVRIKNSNPSNPLNAHKAYSILSQNRPVVFYIDEIEIVGGNALPITPGDTKGKMFLMANLERLSVDPPTLIYDKDFKYYFNNGDDYETVKSILVIIGLPYCEQLLKWIVFGKPNYNNEEHIGIIKFIGEICDMREREFEELTNEADNNKKTKEYLKLSNLLFENIQSMGRGWKKLLSQIIENEKK